jgi:hypothetical protein
VSHQANVFVVRVLSLAAFMGGPWYCTDLLKRHLQTPVAFALCFLPIGLMVLTTLTVLEDAPSRLTRFTAGTGLGGASILVLMNGFTIWRLAIGASHPRSGMIGFGVVAGLLAVAAFTWIVVRFLGGPVAGPGSQV